MTYGMLKFSLMKEDTLLKETLCFSSYITTARLMTLENMKLNSLREARAYAEKNGYWLTISIKKHSEEFTTNSKMVCFWTSQQRKEHSYAQDSRLHCLAPVFYYLSR